MQEQAAGRSAPPRRVAVGQQTVFVLDWRVAGIEVPADVLHRQVEFRLRRWSRDVKHWSIISFQTPRTGGSPEAAVVVVLERGPTTRSDNVAVAWRKLITSACSADMDLCRGVWTRRQRTNGGDIAMFFDIRRTESSFVDAVHEMRQVAERVGTNVHISNQYQPVAPGNYNL